MTSAELPRIDTLVQAASEPVDCPFHCFACYVSMQYTKLFICGRKDSWVFVLFRVGKLKFFCGSKAYKDLWAVQGQDGRL